MLPIFVSPCSSLLFSNPETSNYGPRCLICVKDFWGCAVDWAGGKKKKVFNPTRINWFKLWMEYL